MDLLADTCNFHIHLWLAFWAISSQLLLCPQKCFLLSISPINLFFRKAFLEQTEPHILCKIFLIYSLIWQVANMCWGNQGRKCAEHLVHSGSIYHLPCSIHLFHQTTFSCYGFTPATTGCPSSLTHLLTHSESLRISFRLIVWIEGEGSGVADTGTCEACHCYISETTF